MAPDLHSAPMQRGEVLIALRKFKKFALCMLQTSFVRGKYETSD